MYLMTAEACRLFDIGVRVVNSLTLPSFMSNFTNKFGLMFSIVKIIRSHEPLYIIDGGYITKYVVYKMPTN